MTGTGSFIAIPQRVSELLATDGRLLGAVHLTLNAFAPWISDNKLPFFPEFTDHGPRHISEVLATATSIVTDGTWQLLTAADGAALTLSVLLHDSAMHLTEDGFAWLIQQSQPGLSVHSDLPWNLLWQMFLGEVSRWDERRIEDVFGHRNRPRRPPTDPSQFTNDDRRLIGEFVRRHHARLAHEIAIWGIPGVNGRVVTFHGLQPPVLQLIGLIARSHNLPIRRAVDLLDPNDSRDPFGIHAPFLMGILRIADYLQIHAERAPGALLLVRSLRSPISSAEWRTHLAVEAINNTQNDPEAIYVRAMPLSASIFLKLRALLNSIQTELDETWATLGEVYGRFGSLSELRLGIRRVRSNIDDAEKFAGQVPYLPRSAAFTSAGADLLKLLIKPLYGDQPELGIRELIQNAVDAVRERIDLDAVSRDGIPAPAVMVDVISDSSLLGEVIVRDHGVGMTADVITGFFLKAGASFRRTAIWKQQHMAEDGTSRVLRSGRFGIGALAAFLLGERIEVTTRHISEAHGISFSASVDDAVVELRRVDCELGTTVRIRITDPAIVRQLTKNPQTWDWYCCDTPEVQRTINGVPLSRQLDCPPAGATLPSTWRRIEAPGYNDVQWTYSLPNRTMLFCNGIRVGQSAKMSTTTHAIDLPELYRDPSSLTVRLPSVSVFDADANLPLNLQRSGLVTARYPFHDELLDGVLADFVAFALVNAPSDPHDLLTQGSSWLNYAGITSEFFAKQEDERWLWFWHTPLGIALSDPWTFRALGPSRVITVRRHSRVLRGLLSENEKGVLPFKKEYVVPFDWRTTLFKDTEQWLRWAFGGPANNLGPLGDTRAKAVRALVTTSCYNAMVVKKLWQDAIEHSQQLSSDWYMLSQGPVEEPALDYEAIAQVPANGYEVMGEVYLIHSGSQAPESAPSKAWQQLIGGPIIPYDGTARQLLIESLPNVDDIRAHQEQRAELDRAVELSLRMPSNDKDEKTDP
jgi:molecular chaperone HtpG